MGRLKLFPSQRHSLKSIFQLLFRTHNTRVNLLTYLQIHCICIAKVELRYSEKISRIYSRFYTSFRENSLGQIVEDLHSSLKGKELDIIFFPNLSYIKKIRGKCCCFVKSFISQMRLKVFSERSRRGMEVFCAVCLKRFQSFFSTRFPSYHSANGHS